MGNNLFSVKNVSFLSFQRCTLNCKIKPGVTLGQCSSPDEYSGDDLVCILLKDKINAA